MKVNTGNSHPEAVVQRCSVKKVFLAKKRCSLAKFTGKHLCQTLAQEFFCEFCEISKNLFFIAHLWWLLLLLLGNSRATAKIDNSYIKSEDAHVLQGVTIDSNLTFQNYINSICRKAIQKLRALIRIVPYYNI